MDYLYKYAIEEKWTNIEDIGISKDFFSLIINNKYNIIEEKNDYFKFIYVGILVYRNEILLVLPKYYDEKYSKDKVKCIQKLIKLLKKIPYNIINENKDALFISRDIDDHEISEIALADYIIKDYIKNGYYINKYKNIKLDSNGNIEWNKTINKTIPIISNGYPIYDKYYSVKNKINYDNEIYIIHKAVVNICINKYADLLGYNVKIAKNNSINELKKIGDNKKICSLLINELNNVYTDREIKLLKCMYSFFDPLKEKSNKGLNLYGTKCFNLVWQYLCGYIFDNEFENYKKDIPIPKWKKYDSENETNFVTNSRNKLIPDIIKTYKNKIMIIDAKYYSIELTGEEVTGNPGTYDIVKQYTYEIAIRKKYKDYKIINVLLYPKEMNVNIDFLGWVSLDIFELKPILNIYINPIYVIDLYLNSKKLTINDIEYIISKSNISYDDSKKKDNKEKNL